jgi:hypothetical protein
MVVSISRQRGSVETIFERVGALDVRKAQVTACVRVPDTAGRRAPHLAEFATTVRGLVALRDWLEAHRVTHMAMEATGVYQLRLRRPECKGVRVPAGEGFVDDGHGHRVRNENGAPAQDISVIMGPPTGPFRSDLDPALSGCGS